jgi:methylated-DNA-[protein]-cysteine S-methyltransferase
MAMDLLDEIAPRYASIDTDAGRALYAYTAHGVAMLSTDMAERRFVEEVTDLLGKRPIRHEPPQAFIKKVRACIERGDGTMVDWSRMPPFQRRVLQATAKIPYGKVRSYGDIADLIGAPRAQRAVGTACARNPVPLLIPCHRVVRGDGTLGRYGMGGTERKRALLLAEGYPC